MASLGAGTNYQDWRLSPSISVREHDARKCRVCTTVSSSLDRRVVKRQVSEFSHTSSERSIPISLGDIVPDPGGVLESTGVISSRDFWRFYHAEDGPVDPAAKRMGQKWGELWLSYLVSDPVVLSGAVPLVLQKKAQLTLRNEDRSVHMAEMKALKLLRRRLESLDAASLGGLIMAVCGRVQIAIQQADFSAASMHLQAVKKLMSMHVLTGTEWLCSAWSDLRVVSSTGASPILPRFTPTEWRDMPSMSQKSAAESQYLAMRNARAFKTCAGSKFHLLYSIFRCLHELEAAANYTSSPQHVSMQQIYDVTYDSCLLHASSRREAALGPAADEVELVAICLKLCAWERASHCIPRGGEIERTLLRRALQILRQGSNSCPSALLHKSDMPSNAQFWLLFTLTATASAFAPDELEIWTAQLKSVTQLSTPSTFKRALKGWPTMPWWLTRAVERICARMKPVNGSWRKQILDSEKDAAFGGGGGMRLKLLVIED